VQAAPIFEQLPDRPAVVPNAELAAAAGLLRPAVLDEPHHKYDGDAEQRRRHDLERPLGLQRLGRALLFDPLADVVERVNDDDHLDDGRRDEDRDLLGAVQRVVSLTSVGLTSVGTTSAGTSAGTSVSTSSVGLRHLLNKSKQSIERGN